ncbi:MAG: type II toxin-antitoxin system death-on-curing family toxin, partial [Gammaproteobacteria bacterium]|nr:type II toxin-antitoxin system death-on-curing family toxin [Gammaproteobacteria bacterium]
MSIEPIWIDKSVALSVHERQIAEHGGLTGIRDDGLLNSALAKPQQHYVYAEPSPGIPELAAVLEFGIARNHPFADGNKRTAAVLMELFLDLNGYVLFATDEELLEKFLKLASGSLDDSDLADWLTTKVADGTDDGVHENR